MRPHTHTAGPIQYLSDGSSEKIQAVIEANVCPRLIELLKHKSSTVQKPALRTVGNIMNSGQVQHRLLPMVSQMLSLYTVHHSLPITQLLLPTTDRLHKPPPHQMKSIVEQGCIPPLFEVLGEARPAIVTIALKHLRNILEVSGTSN